jgi:hypothetical protein
MTKRTIDDMVREVFPGREMADVAVILDTSYLVGLPEEKYARFLAGSKEYHFVITKAVEKELHYQPKGITAPLITKPLKRFIYDQLQPEKIDYQATGSRKKFIKHACKKGCRKDEPISEADMGQIAYAMELQEKQRIPVVILAEDSHIKGTVKELRKYGYNIFAL